MTIPFVGARYGSMSDRGFNDVMVGGLRLGDMGLDPHEQMILLRSLQENSLTVS